MMLEDVAVAWLFDLVMIGIFVDGKPMLPVACFYVSFVLDIEIPPGVSAICPVKRKLAAIKKLNRHFVKAVKSSRLTRRLLELISQNLQVDFIF